MRLRTVFFIVVTPLSSLVSCTAPPPAAAPPPPPPPTSAPPPLLRNKHQQPRISMHYTPVMIAVVRAAPARPAARSFFLLLAQRAKKFIARSAPGRPQAEERGRRVVRRTTAWLRAGRGRRGARAARSQQQEAKDAASGGQILYCRWLPRSGAPFFYYCSYYFRASEEQSKWLRKKQCIVATNRVIGGRVPPPAFFAHCLRNLKLELEVRKNNRRNRAGSNRVLVVQLITHSSTSTSSS